MFIYLDTETTGYGPDDRLCQIAFKPENVLKKAVSRIEKKVEIDRTAKINEAIDHLKTKVEEKNQVGEAIDKIEEKVAKQGSEKGKKVKQAKSIADRPKVSTQERAEMVATAAYYIAEGHGFTPGQAEADWKAAEKEIDQTLKGKKKRKPK